MHSSGKPQFTATFQLVTKGLTVKDRFPHWPENSRKCPLISSILVFKRLQLPDYSIYILNVICRPHSAQRHLGAYSVYNYYWAFKYPFHLLPLPYWAMRIFEVRARDTFMGLISSQRLGHISLKSNSRRRVKNVKIEMNDVNYL